MKHLARIFLCIVSVTIVVAGCGEEPTISPRFETAAKAIGEPVGDYPSIDERRILYLTNRARTEPSAFNPDDPYPPSPPLKWDLQLSKAARFHARHIIEASCWCEDHSSCCTLGGAGDQVSCQSSVTGCGAMSSGDRVALWSGSYSGENMARGQMSAEQAIQGWIFSPGHWANINGSHSLLGAGNHQTAWVQDFGTGGGAAPVASDGIHMLDGQSIRFGSTYFQPNTGGPQVALVIVGGECHELNLTHGTPELGAFETSQTLEPGCHRYYFHFTDGDGADHVYPSTGSFGVAVGNTDNCPFYSEDKPADTCSPSGQSCETGHTRFCYTGPFGTRNVGICEEGVERCVGGQWTGECRNETHPEGAEMCGNQTDDDCDGEVDEECAPENPDMGAPDAGAEADGGAGPLASVDRDDEGCSVIPGKRASGHVGVVAVLLGLVLVRLGRRRVA